jgi:spermidine/putrescine transport system permease protein
VADVDENGTKPNRWHTPYLLLLPGLVALILFFIIPLFSIAQLSLKDGGLGNYSKVLTDNSTVILRTFEFSALATIGALLIGYPLAYFIAMRGEIGRAHV